MIFAKGVARLSAAVLVLGLSPYALGAPASSDTDEPTLISPSAYHIERIGNQGIKLTSKNPENSYAISLVGSNGETSVVGQSLQAADAWQRSVGVEVEGKLGGFLNTDLRTRFTELDRPTDVYMFGRPLADGSPGDRRAVEEYSFTTKFLGDRVSLASSRRSSNFGLGESSTNGRSAAFEQDRLSAWVWRTGRSSFSVEGMLSRVDSNYQDFTQLNTTEALQLRNKETLQVRSKFNMGRAGVFVTQRDSTTLTPDQSGARARQSEVETGVSLRLSDLRESQDGSFADPFFYLLPDSIWISTDHGAVGHDNDAGAAPGQLEKSAVGVTRNWNGAAVNVSYWQSAIDAASGPIPDDAQWRGNGMDVAGNVRSGRLSFSGNLSWYKAGNVAAWSNSAENSLNGSLYLTWSPVTLWPKLSAGISNYAYQAAFFDYNGLEQSSVVRYELAVDSSRLLQAWSDIDATLKFLASYQGNESRSQWVQTAYSGSENLFFGFRLTRPFHH